MELRFRETATRTMGFSENLGWEMGIEPPLFQAGCMLDRYSKDLVFLGFQGLTSSFAQRNMEQDILKKF